MGVEKYIVLHLNDIEDSLTDQQVASLKDIIKTVSDYRFNKNKKSEPGYYVVNTEAPYAHLVKEILDQNQDGVKF